MTRSRLREDVLLVRLDRRLATPLFRQVYQRIRDAILGWHPAAWRLVALLTQLSCPALHCSRDDRVGVRLVSRRRLRPGAGGVRYSCQSEPQALVDAGR